MHGVLRHFLQGTTHFKFEGKDFYLQDAVKACGEGSTPESLQLVEKLILYSFKCDFYNP